MTQQSHWATDSFESTEINWSEQFSFQMQGRRATLLHRAGRYAPNNREIRCRCFGGLDQILRQQEREESILRANGPVPLRRFPVHHLPVMVPKHSHGVVGFSEPTRTLLHYWLPGERARVAGARSVQGSGDRPSFGRIREASKRMNSRIPACLSSLGFRLLFERGIQVSACGDLLNVFLQECFSSQALVLGYVNEFVCQQS